jgi:hypothetical protein
MAGLVSAVRNNNSQDLSVSPVIGPMTASLVEQDESFRAQRGGPPPRNGHSTGDIRISCSAFSRRVTSLLLSTVRRVFRGGSSAAQEHKDSAPARQRRDISSPVQRHLQARGDVLGADLQTGLRSSSTLRTVGSAIGQVQISECTARKPTSPYGLRKPFQT